MQWSLVIGTLSVCLVRWRQSSGLSALEHAGLLGIEGGEARKGGGQIHPEAPTKNNVRVHRTESAAFRPSWTYTQKDRLQETEQTEVPAKRPLSHSKKSIAVSDWGWDCARHVAGLPGLFYHFSQFYASVKGVLTTVEGKVLPNTCWPLQFCGGDPGLSSHEDFWMDSFPITTKQRGNHVWALKRPPSGMTQITIMK